MRTISLDLSLDVATRHDNQIWDCFELTAPMCRSGEWKYEFKMSTLAATLLNLLFAEAEQKGKTLNFRTYIGPGSDGFSADKLWLDLKFNPWDTANSFRPEWHSMSETVFTQYDKSESWRTEQKDAWPR